MNILKTQVIPSLRNIAIGGVGLWALVELLDQFSSLIHLPSELKGDLEWVLSLPDWIRTILLILIIVAIIWAERTRNEAKYLTEGAVDAKVSTATTQLANELRREIGTQKDTIASLALLEYLENEKPTLDRKVEGYRNAWNIFETFIKDPTRNWSDNRTNEQLHNSTRPLSGTLPDLNRFIQWKFNYPWIMPVEVKDPILPAATDITHEPARLNYLTRLRDFKINEAKFANVQRKVNEKIQELTNQWRERGLKS